MALGSITFEQEPTNAADKVPVITNWNPLIGYMLFQDDISGLYYFRLILEVYKGTSVVAANLLAKIKQRRNGYSPDNAGATQRARAFFDLRDIVNSQLVDTVFDQNQTGIPFEPIHTIGSNTGVLAKIYSQNGDSRTDETQIMSIHVKGFQQYASTATAIPSEDDSPNVTDTLYYIQASLPLMTARDTDSDYIQGTAFQPYQGSANTDLFLSDVEVGTGEYNISGRINHIQDTDYHTVAFLNDYTNFTSDIDWIGIIYYDSSGSTIGNAQYIANTNANGGAIPNSEVNTDPERLIYFGCGAGNLEASTVPAFSSAGTSAGAAQPSNFTDWAYYTVAGYNGSFALQTTLYYFIKQDGSCKGFNVRRLAWRNSLGCYDYFNFKKKSTQTIEVTRNNYETIMGRFNASKWYYNNTMRGKKTRETTAVLKETLNTDWINEADANLLEKLIMSTDVYIVENADTDFTEGVIITDTSFVKKTVANNKMIQYTVQIEYANNVNTNS
jgi:hypothetical protein|tara:strand:+ start:1235 stop:2731 length:1497 start_codon:yes stop_codon:yes gene_type:complete